MTPRPKLVLSSLGLVLGSGVLAGPVRAQCPGQVLYDPNGAKQEQLGVSVDYDGTTLVAGKRGLNNEGGVVVWRRNGATFAYEASIAGGAQPAAAGENFGRHVAVDGDTMAVLSLDPDRLALFDRVVDPGTGAVSWQFNTSYTLAGGTFKGTSVDLDGDVVVFGRGATFSGVVYYVVRNGSAWGPQESLTSPAFEAGGGFGRTVSLSGNLLAVTAPGEAADGRVYVYQLNSSTGLFGLRSTLHANLPPGTLGDVALGGNAIVPTLWVANRSESVNGVPLVGRVHGYVEQLQPFPNDPLWVLTDSVQAGDPLENGFFGTSLSLFDPFFGSPRLLVGASGYGAGRIYVFESSGSGMQEKRIIEGDDGGVGGAPQFANFMTSVGNTVVAAHSQLDGPGGVADFDQGAIVVHDLDASTCPLECTQPRLADDGLAALDEAGADVAIEGDLALVGVPSADGAAPDAGAVRVYRKLQGCWYHETTLVASDAAAGDGFGSSVSIGSTGDYAIVGAPGKDVSGLPDAGGAYVYYRPESVWVEVAALEPPNPRTNGVLGTDVDVVGGAFPFAIVGGPGEPDDLGRAIRFELDLADGDWNPVETHVSPFSNAFVGDEYGSAVSAAFGFYAVGDPFEDLAGANQGAVYAFHLDNGTWVASGNAFGLTNSAGERFGASLDTNGLSLVVGAPGADFGGVPAAGRVHGFTVTASGGLLPRGSAGAPVPLSGDGLGRSVALDAANVVVGADDSAGVASGTAHLFELVSGAPVWVSDFVPPGAAGGARFGTAVDLDGTNAIVGAPLDDGVATGGTGSAWIVDYPNLTTFSTDFGYVSQANGGTQSWSLNLGESLGGHLYWIVGSATGTSPGVPFPPFVLPLNFDLYYKITLKFTNGQIFEKTLGFLDASGKAQAAFHMPPGVPLLADTYQHAALILDPVTLAPTGATNAMPLSFLP